MRCRMVYLLVVAVNHETRAPEGRRPVTRREMRHDWPLAAEVIEELANRPLALRDRPDVVLILLGGIVQPFAMPAVADAEDDAGWTGEFTG